MLKFLSKLFLWILTNGPPIVTVLFAIYVILLANLGKIDDHNLLIWILTIIGLMATSELISRLITLNKLESTTNKISDKILLMEESGTVTVSKVFENGAHQLPIHEKMENAKNISINGTTLIQVSTQFRGEYEERLRSGCNLRFLLVKPNSESVKLVGKRNYEAKGAPNKFVLYLNESIDNLSMLSNLPDKRGICEVRILNYVPSFGIIIIETKDGKEDIFIQLFPYKSPHGNRPWFQIDSATDSMWFKYFKSQYETMWNDATPLN